MLSFPCNAAASVGQDDLGKATPSQNDKYLTDLFHIDRYMPLYRYGRNEHNSVFMSTM